MKKSRVGALVAVAAAGALVLAGCSSTGGGTPSAKPTGGTVRVATVNDMTSLNSNTPQSNLDTTGMMAYLTGGAFNYPDNNFKLVKDTDLGTYEKVSDDPLTVKYTLNKDAKWSDGEPITADDLVLGWAIGSGHYDDATFDPETGDVKTGTQYFAIAGSTAGLDTTDFPTIGDDNRSITLKYGTPFVDWELVNPLAQPAHIVAKKAGLASAADLTKLLKSLPKGDPAHPVAANDTLKKAAAFVTTGYDMTSFPTDPDVLVASGPWVFSAWTPGQSIELKPNPEYKGKLKPSIDKLVLRIIGDAAAQATALQNGEIDIAYPQASADTKKSFDAISGINVLTGNQVSYDHLDLNFKAPVFKDAKVREAFLLTIPREQIVDAIVKPINPSAKPLDSQIFLPNQAEYAKSVAQNGSDEFNKVDIDKAKSLLAEAGVTAPTVKILYNTKNPNRVDEFQAIQASAAKAGFKVVDGGDPKWSSLLAAGNYDASIFGWISPGVGTAALPQIFSSQGGGNYNGFTYADEPALATQTAIDPAKLTDLMMQVDKLTFTNGYGLPLFQAAGVWGVSKKIDGVKYMGNQTGPVWNTWDWSVKTSSSSK